MKRLMWWLAIAVLWPATALAQRSAAASAGDSSSVAEAVHSIRATDILERISVIADDSMRGRATPSPGLEAVAHYVAGLFRSAGLKPGGDGGTFLQRYPIQRVRLDLAASALTVQGGPTWQLGSTVIRHLGPTEVSGVSGPTVVVTGSPADPDVVLDQAIQGAMVLVVFPFTPAANLLVQGIVARNPAAVVLVTQRPDSRWTQLLAQQDRERTVTGWSREGGVPVLEVRGPTLAPVLGARGFDLAAAQAQSAAPVTVTPLPGLELTLTLRDTVVSQFTAPNVVGILEGSDPVLKNEYVVFSAHMDHVGTADDGSGCVAIQGDRICNGADDDASGTIGVVELAEAFAKLTPRPRRSLIFLTVSGEERGLWGSDFFTEHPPVPISHLVADLNIDMIGRNWKDTIVVIGKEHSDLGGTLARVNAAHPELRMTAIDDLWPEENFYTRSDHFNFARKGVPILFFFNGVHADYHRPTDEVGKIDPEKESRVVQLIFYLGLEIGNATQPPKWNPASHAAVVEPRGGSR